MSRDDRPKRDTIAIEEVTVSNMWEIAALWKCSNGRASARNKISITSSPSFPARIPVPAFLKPLFLSPYLLTETENTIIDDILALLNKHGLTSHQSQNLLERLERIIEMGQRVASDSNRSISRQQNRTRNGEWLCLLNPERSTIYTSQRNLLSLFGTIESFGWTRRL